MLVRTGVGLTVMVNVFDVPIQLAGGFDNVGVTIIVATTGAVPVLVAVKERISPEPEAGIPIPGWSFVHEYVVVPIVLVVVKRISVVASSLQCTWSPGWFTCPSGL